MQNLCACWTTQKYRNKYRHSFCVEAFQSNVPVLVANNSCLPEVGGDAVIGFDPYDVNELADLLQQVLTDTHLQETLKQKGKQRLAYFSWEKASAALIKVFKKAAHGNP